MIPKVGVAVLGKDKNGEFLHGYVKDVVSGKIKIDHGGCSNTKLYDAPNVFYFRNGYPVAATACPVGPTTVFSAPRSSVATCSGPRITNRKRQPKHGRMIQKYNRRKVAENACLIYDVVSLGFNITECKLLALDDFPRKAAASTSSLRPSTTSTWMRHGGKASHVWVPNPDATVAESITRLGGHGLTMTLKDMLSDKAIRESLPRFNVVYMDLCGFFSSHREDLEYLFRYHSTLLSDRVLLHLTTCKREGSNIMDEVVFPALHEWCQEYHYGRATKLMMKHSETMWKGAFLLLKDPC